MKIEPHMLDTSGLSAAECVALAETLMHIAMEEKHGDGFSLAQKQEIERRMQATARGEIDMVPWDQAKKWLIQSLDAIK